MRQALTLRMRSLVDFKLAPQIVVVRFQFLHGFHQWRDETGIIHAKCLGDRFYSPIAVLNLSIADRAYQCGKHSLQVLRNKPELRHFFRFAIAPVSCKAECRST